MLDFSNVLRGRFAPPQTRAQALGSSTEPDQRKPPLRHPGVKASAELRSVGHQHDRIERRRAADEQPVALGPAEGDVGDDLRDQDLADQAFRRARSNERRRWRWSRSARPGRGESRRTGRTCNRRTVRRRSRCPWTPGSGGCSAARSPCGSRRCRRHRGGSRRAKRRGRSAAPCRR